MHAVAAPVAGDGGARVVEPLDGAYELVTVPRVGRVEVQRARVTQVPLRDEVRQDDEAMAGPALVAQGRERAWRRDMIAGPEVNERAPPVHREQGVLGRRHDLTAERGMDTIDHPATARCGIEHAPLPDLHVRVA